MKIIYRGVSYGIRERGFSRFCGNIESLKIFPETKYVAIIAKFVFFHFLWELNNNQD